MDTLRRRDFDRSERLPKSLALLETLADRTAYRGVAPASTNNVSSRVSSPTKRNTTLLGGFVWWEKMDSNHRS